MHDVTLAEEPLDPSRDRDPASSRLIEHIQTATEHQKALLARELHDELGGLLVGAVMDLAWAEQHLSASAADLKQKLTRARVTLSAAIDLKRRLIEELRPTLLDNVGLFAALRWHVQAICKCHDIACEIELPEEEQRFLPHIPIALFRIVQEAYAVLLAPGKASSSHFEAVVDRHHLGLSIGLGAPPGAHVPDAVELHSLAAIAYRVAALGGCFDHAAAAAGGVHLKAVFPIDSVLAAAPPL